LRLSGGGVGVALAPSFHTADRQTYRRVVVVGVFFCAAFVLISLSMRPRVEETVRC
jgi:hypothetical protein